MKDKKLYLFWLYLFILCAALGFIPERNPLVTALLAIACLAFFVPGGILLYRGIRAGERRHLRRILLLSILSLAITALLFIVYWFAVSSASELVCSILYAVLLVFSTPLACAPYPAISMFLWACMLFTVISFWKKTK